jgi:hypothetical protein
MKLLPALALAGSVALLLSMLGHRVAAADQADRKDGKMLFHVVSLKFKPDASKDQIKAVEDAFAALREKVPGVAVMTWGTNVSPEKHDKGFTHCFILGFGNEKDRNAYLVHPEHKAFGKVLGPVMGDVMVLDFWGDVKHDQAHGGGQ